ncbi:hypothetical protein CKA32_005256 [Geitlerinema sp. FC II]|nr:hypothetical protein CKA32_005256 [Geitlerinema sp. FC II]
MRVSDSFLSFVPRLGSGGQGFVVNQTNAAQSPAQEVFLCRGRVETISEGSQYHALHFRTVCCNPKTGGGASSRR